VTARALLLLVALYGTADADTPPRHGTARWLAVGVADLAYVLFNGVLEGPTAPDRCRWCAPPDFDADLRHRLVWTARARAGTLSDLTAYPAPTLAAGVLLAVGARDAPCLGRRLSEDALPIAEAYVYTQLVTVLVKVGVGRERPDVHFDGGTGSSEDNLSFVSGHTAAAFSIAVAAGSVAHRRHYRTEWAIWASTLTFAAATAYLRIAADRHYFSDVAAGAAIGAAGGYVLPRLLEGRVIVAPSPSGIAVAGAF